MSSRSAQHYSEEYLNAFLDGQLDGQERSSLLDEVIRDQTLSARVCELQKVREMVQLTYHDVISTQAPASHRPGRGLRAGRPFGKAIAAGVLLALGVLAGWMSNAALDSRPGLLDLAQSIQAPRSPLAANGVWRVMLHVSTADPTRLNTVLEATEHLLQQSQHSARKVRVEVLANGQGLQLLNAHNAHYARKIRELESKYGNLSFLACSKALARLKQEQGVALDLTRGAKVVPSAIGEIIHRQREGWTYIHI